MILTIAGITLLVMMICLIYRNKGKLAEQEMLKKQTALEETYYFNLKEQQKNIQDMREDMLSFLSKLKSMDDTEEMARSFYETHESLSSVEISRNSVANAVAWDKKNRAGELGADIEYSIMLPPEIGISDVDFISLMANLLNNALEAVVRLEQCERKIFFLAKADNGTLFFQCKNRKRAEEQPIHTNFKSRKKDSAFHGLGRKIIMEIVEKYDGILKDTDTGEWLETEVLLLSERGGKR